MRHLVGRRPRWRECVAESPRNRAIIIAPNCEGTVVRFWLLALLCWCTTGMAAPLLVLDRATPDRIDLRAHLDVVRDPDKALDADSVRRATQAQRLSPGIGLNFGYTRDALWLRIDIQSELPVSSDWRLELDYPSLDHAELYDGRSVQRAGDRIPLTARAIAHRNPVFALQLAPGERRSLLVRVESEGSLTVNPVLWRAAAFHVHSERSYAWQALYFGMLLALCGYNLLLWLILRDRAYFYYVLFGVSVGVGIASIYGMAGQFLWPASVDWSNRALVVGIAVSGVVAPLFAQAFLNTAAGAPRWHRWLTAIAVVHALILVMGLFAPMRVAMQAMSVGTLANCLLMLACGVDCARRGLPGARIYVAAWASMLLGGVMMALRNFGLLPTHFLTLHGMQVGSALEMLLLSFALASRFNQIRAEKEEAQRRLVASLQQQERELEARVAQRTAELAEANERLKALAHSDPLTGLANRAALSNYLNGIRQTPVTLLLIDLDGFKPINDRHGHEAGDRVLVEIAGRLRAVLDSGTMVARLGGDEFVVVLPAAVDAAAVAERMLAIVRQPLASVPAAQVGASIGIATGEVDAAGNELLRRADAAMYAAKAAGKGLARWANG
jgi:diguanylate cyclase (GGDEF)-like protein